MTAKEKKQCKKFSREKQNENDEELNHGIFHPGFFRFRLKSMGPVGIYVAARMYGATAYAGRNKDPKGYTTITASDLSRQTGCLVKEAAIRRARTKLRNMGLLYNSGTNARPRWHQTLDRPLFRKSLASIGCPPHLISLIMARVSEIQDQSMNTEKAAEHGA